MWENHKIIINTSLVCVNLWRNGRKYNSGAVILSFVVMSSSVLLFFFLISFSGAKVLKVTIGAIFEPSEFTRFNEIFEQTISEQEGTYNGVSFRGVAIPSMENLYDNIRGLCNFISNNTDNNVVAFIVFGSRKTLNSISLVTETLGVPVLGYVTDKEDTHQRVRLSYSHFYVAKYYGRLRLIRSVLRASQFFELKLIEIVILWVYYTIPCGFSLDRHFWSITFHIFKFFYLT